MAPRTRRQHLRTLQQQVPIRQGPLSMALVIRRWSLAMSQIRAHLPTAQLNHRIRRQLVPILRSPIRLQQGQQIRQPTLPQIPRQPRTPLKYQIPPKRMWPLRPILPPTLRYLTPPQALIRRSVLVIRLRVIPQRIQLHPQIRLLKRGTQALAQMGLRQVEVKI